MRVGDLLEVFAAAAFVIAAYFWQRSTPLALLIAGICLAYFGQCYGSQQVRLPRPRLPFHKKPKS